MHNVKDEVKLEFGYIIQALHEHIPTLQMFGKEKTNKPRWKALKEILIFLDEYLVNYINNYEIPFSKEEMQDRQMYENKYFRKLLNLNFYRSPYIKEIEIRKFHIRAFLHHAIIETIKFIINNKKYNELFESYKIDTLTPYEKFIYKGVEFKNSIFYDDFIMEVEKSPEDIVQQAYKNYSYNDVPINNKVYFQSLQKANVLLTEKTDIKEIYGYTNREYNSLQKSKDEVFTIKFDKIRYKSKKEDNKNKSTIFTKLNVTINKDYLLTVFNEKNYDIRLRELLTIIYVLKNQNEFIYYERNNFRYTTNKKFNKINFQGLEKEIRKKIFVGQYDYDLNTAAPTLLYQFIKKQIPDIEFPYIAEYIKDRNIIRNECIKLLQMKNPNKKEIDLKKEVKSLITAVFYGANIRNKQSDITMSYNDRIYLLDNSSDFYKLIENVEKLYKIYKDFIQKKYHHKDFIQMPNGIINLKDDENKNISNSKIVSSIYFSLESQILDLIYEKYKDSLTLLIHDGFISKDELDVNELEKLVKDELGYDVKYEKVKL